MNKEEIYEMINASPVMHLATIDEEGKPHVRGILMYKADENGIVFHTGEFKALYKQLMANPAAEVCFACKGGVQIRVEGKFEPDESDSIKEEIYNHPSRKFLRDWSTLEEAKKFLKVFRMKNGKAHAWTMADNFKAKEYIEL